MAVQVIDSKGEVEAYIAQTAAEEIPPAAPATEMAAESPASTEQPPAADPDDVEGDDGLTPREKRELSAKMLKAIGKRTAQRKDAEDFAAAQYAERQLAERRAAAAERELAELKAKAVPDVSRETAAPDPEAGKPKREAFQTDEAYWDAVIDWRADKRAEKILKEERQRQADERAQQERLEIQTAAETRVAKALELVPDFQQKVLDAADNIRIPTAITGYMERSPLMPELAYHLATHPTELEALLKLRPDEQLVTIGKIEGTLKPFGSDGDSKARQTDGATPSETGRNGQQPRAAATDETGIAPSRARDAAPVIRPLNGNGAAAVEVEARDMNIRETIADFSKRNKVDLRLRKRH